MPFCGFSISGVLAHSPTPWKEALSTEKIILFLNPDKYRQMPSRSNYQSIALTHLQAFEEMVNKRFMWWLGRLGYYEYPMWLPTPVFYHP